MVSNFRITLPHTDILINRTSTDILSYDNLKDFYNKSPIDIKIQKSYVTLSDFGAFIPRLKNTRTPMGIATHLQGTVDNLKGDLHIDYGNNDIVLSAEARPAIFPIRRKRLFPGKSKN